MSNIFYNCVSIIIGLVLIYFGITQLLKKKLPVGITASIHSVLFLGTGICGFFLPQEYQFITILAMLAFCITMAIPMILIKDGKNSKKNSNSKALK